MNQTLDFGPHIINDDGGDLVNLLHTERTVAGLWQEAARNHYRHAASGARKEGKLAFPWCLSTMHLQVFIRQSVWNQSVCMGRNVRTTNLIVRQKCGSRRLWLVQ